MVREDTLEFTQRDVEGVSRLLAAWMSSQQTVQQQVSVTVVKTIEIDLGTLASAVAGLQDPLGQLREAIANLLNVIAAKIIASIQGIIEAVVGGLRTLIEGLQAAIGKIPKAIDALRETLQKFVLDPLLKALDWVREALPKLVELVQNFIASIQRAITEIPQQLANMVTTIVNAFKAAFQRLYDVLNGFVNALQDAFSTIVTSLVELGRRIQSIFESIAASLSGFMNTLASTLQNFVNMVANALKSIVDAIARIPATIVEVLQDAVGRLQSIFATLVNVVRNIVGTITSALGNIVNTISSIASAIANVVSSLAARIQQALNGIVTFINDVARRISEALAAIPSMIANVVRTIRDYFTVFINSVQNVVANITRQLAGVTSTITNFVNSVISSLQAIPAAIRGALDAVMNSINAFVASLRNALNAAIANISSFIESVRSAFNQVAGFLADAISHINEFVNNVVNVVRSAATQIIDTISRIVNSVQEAVARLGEWLSTVAERITEFINNLFSQLTAAVTNAINTIKDFVLNLPRYAVQAMENVTAWIWEHLPDWVKQFLTEAPKALQLIATTFQGYVNALFNFPRWFPKWFLENIAKPIADAIFGAINWLWERVSAIVDSLRKWLSGVATLTDQILSLLTPAVDFVRTVVEQGLVAIAPRVENVIWDAFGFVRRVIAMSARLIEGVREIIENVVRPAASKLAEPMREMIQSIVAATKRAFDGLRAGQSIDEVYHEFFTAVVPYTMSTVAITEAIRATGREVNRAFSLLTSLLLSGIAVAEGEPIIALANIIERGAWGVVAELPRSVVFWMAEPLRKPLDFAMRYALRNEFPIEIPTLTQIRDILRRAMAAGKYDDLNKTLIEFIKMRGYSDDVISLLFGGPEVLATTITDRFGGKRLVPLTLLWETPTRTDLIRMLQRDVLQSPMEWARFIAVYGLNEDLGKLYYLASFEYPSFEKLWEFFVRGISGMLWYEPPEFIQEWFKQDAEWLGAGVPVPPKNLNYDYKALFKAIPFYLKWIQKSNFSWFRKGATLRYGNLEIQIDFDWTADSWMLWDIAADLPGKIDARWMAKWGLFDLISEKVGITIPNVGQSPTAYPELPFVDLVSSVVETNVTSPVVMDLRAFSRLLVANGLHPAWVPITAVAEAINALSDERTLLRTGFLNLFKEGFWSLETVDKLLQGFVTASFIVEYFDPARRQWVAGVINTPVKFLPAERKLLEIRALMDRALDILRDATKEAIRAFTENIVESYEEMMSVLNETISSINEWFAREVREITGKELKLGLDKPYWDAYETVAKRFREIFTIRRIRYWVGRVLGWLFYRLAYGYVKPEDIKALFEDVAKAARLVTEEREFIEQLMERVVGIAKREYIPTPSQLATIAEVVPEVIKLSKEVFEARGVPEEWQSIWMKYIEVKPLSDEVRRLISTAITYYAKGVISDEELSAILEWVKQFGWTDREIEIIKMIADIRKKYVEMREEAKQYIPTPSMLATIAEVVPEAVKYVEQVFEARHVPEEWRPIWAKYIEVKPIVDEVRRLLTAYARALRYGVDLGELEKIILDVAANAGWTQREIEIIKLRATVEEIIDETRELRRQYLPTPLTLATLAEYVEVPIELVKKTLEARKVPPEWMELWLRYIQVRPLADEARMLATVFFKAKRYGVPLGDLEQTVLQILRELGFTERELQLRMLRATIEAMIDEWREAQRQYIPTPSMLATIAEIVPEARRLLPLVLQARRVPREWVAVWTKYVALKPLYDEIRGLISSVRRLYEYFAIRPEEFHRWLERLKPWGFEDQELQLILARSEVERARRAWMELVGTPKGLVTMAEYSPTARRVALSLVERMIDALPTDQATKEFLKQMWREYIMVKPVYDEVRRYITELISDYANGVISYEELRRELEALKQWGIDDYEIQFYLWLAERRRQRYARRRS